MRLKNKLYIKIIAIFTLLLTLGIFLYSCKKPDKKVLFNLNGGSINGSQNSVEVVVKHGEKISSDKIPQPTKEKSRLLGWYNGENLFNFDAEKIEKDITLLAKWQEQVKLTLPENVKSNVKDNDRIDKDTEIELEYIPQAGKILKSFKVNGEEKVQSLVENKLKFKITQDTTVEIEQEISKDAKYQADIDAEFNKIDKLVKNGVIELVEDITKEKVLEKISSTVDVAKVNVNITEIEAGKKYEIELTHREKNTIKNKKQYEFKKVEDLTNYLAELDQEFEKIENAKVSGEIEINEEITKESVKARINQIIDESVVDVNITEVVIGKEYKVELVHKENNKAKKEQNVIFKKALQKYELTLTSDFEVVEPAGLNLSEVLKGTKIKVRVKTPEHKDIKEITKNNIPVPSSEIINNEYEFTMTQNITLKVSFKVKQEYINNLENEFNKLTNIRVIAPNGDIQEEKVKEKVLELVDGSIVSDVVVVKKGDKFEITLTH